MFFQVPREIRERAKVAPDDEDVYSRSPTNVPALHIFHFVSLLFSPQVKRLSQNERVQRSKNVCFKLAMLIYTRYLILDTYETSLIVSVALLHAIEKRVVKERTKDGKSEWGNICMGD
ncbi:hypothetical protein PHLCEN_2v9213 [Hermanssonia centrifuga]|uniref:Uncharacterized protein n=1 Tax=Hermanssonia centrifuga TaxID=98765 RepID=A0A2R6NRI3_9APHY|nr:hypothetical protein PHLCEN_2v9213 [Hermanssonia centrifuga]